uniref:Uncharacterized protein n=1 Tax=Rhizophora mucronata TaxID=61149 RepID=A0A2P2N357_RHIMU
MCLQLHRQNHMGYVGLLILVMGKFNPSPIPPLNLLSGCQLEYKFQSNI